MTDRIQHYRLITNGKQVRRFFPYDAPLPEGWSSFSTDSPLDYANMIRMYLNDGTSS